MTPADRFTCRLPTTVRRSRRTSWVVLALAPLVGCKAEPLGPGSGQPPVTVGGDCSLPADEIFDGGVGRDGIPALSNPEFVGVWDDRTDYLEDDDRVIKVELDGESYAIPHNVLWHHEIVNLDRGTEQVAVTYCPLTGSSMVYDRGAVGGAEFGVSGLLFRNNLIMFDRSSNESLWPQMMREARCGDRDGQDLPMVQGVEMEWLQFRRLHSGGSVIASRPESAELYREYPYGNYEEVDNERTIFPQVLSDRRRPPKERVLGVPDGSGGGTAYPFEALDDAGESLAINDVVSGQRVLILWDGFGKAAYAYRPTVDGQELTIEVRTTPQGNRLFTDVETESVWSWDGLALQGPLQGSRMEPVAEAFVAFWFAWAAFHPETGLWQG